MSSWSRDDIVSFHTNGLSTPGFLADTVGFLLMIETPVAGVKAAKTLCTQSGLDGKKNLSVEPVLSTLRWRSGRSETQGNGRALAWRATRGRITTS